MKASELRIKSVEDLQSDLIDLRKKQFQLRFQLSTDQLANIAEFSQVRKDIARIKTVLNEKAGQ
ncbi:MAG: 50S ribosomal protein L29 [Gammaproteobacteria bacterium]|nr:50S ribosomal protein L29 [Gammaproteobacteria bacterium]MCY4217936.1 50S ribosomal protein L29 [Gammaproteobacteria bacterium]MCY4274212.1 50S ribosomal protein L29 [Gammaproteobacteria bacterium]